MQTLLYKKGFFTYEEVAFALEIPPLTFHRYVQEIRAFNANFDIHKEIKYSRSKRIYYIEQK